MSSVLRTATLKFNISLYTKSLFILKKKCQKGSAKFKKKDEKRSVELEKKWQKVQKISLHPPKKVHRKSWSGPVFTLKNFAHKLPVM